LRRVVALSTKRETHDIKEQASDLTADLIPEQSQRNRNDTNTQRQAKCEGKSAVYDTEYKVLLESDMSNY